MKYKGLKLNKYLTAGLVITGFFLLLGIVGIFWTPYSTTEMSTADRFMAPCAAHPMGTDNFGRDILSRVMSGLGMTVTVGVAVVFTSGAVGLVIGALTGYFGGIADEIIMRFNDALNSFPSILMALVVVSLLGSGKYHVILALSIVFIPSFARVVRSEYIRCKSYDYVTNAKLMGVKPLRIIFVHLLPQAASTFLVAVTIGFNNAILAEAGLSYLGIGVQPPDASLGKMLSDAQGYLFTAPWYALFPGMVIVIFVLGFSLLGEGIRRLGAENVN